MSNRLMFIRSAFALLLALALAAPGELCAQKTPARPARDTVRIVDRDSADAEAADADTVPGPGPFTRAQGTSGPFAVQSSGAVSTRPPRDSAVWVSAPARTASRDTAATRRAAAAARDTTARRTTTAARDTATRRTTTAARDTAARRATTAARDTASRRTTTAARDTSARRTTTAARDTATRRTTTAARDTAARRTTTTARDSAARRNTSRDTAATRRTTTAARDTATRRNTSRDTAATRRTTTAARDSAARRNTSRDTAATRRATTAARDSAARRTAARDSAARRNAPRDTVVIGRGSRADTAGTRRPAVRDTARPRTTAAPRTHRMAAGETFYGIARRYGITTAQLRAVNPDLDWEDVRTGDLLRLPANARDTRAGASSTPAPARGNATTPARTQPAAPRGSRSHTVAAGETLFGIARQYGVTRDAIIEANELETDQVRTGQRLVIPPVPR